MVKSSFHLYFRSSHHLHSIFLSIFLINLVVSSVDIVVQEVVVELQHSQLGQLIYHDAYLEG